MVAAVTRWLLIAALTLAACAQIAPDARAAISVSATASGDTDTEVTSLTYGLTIPSGCTDCGLFVCAANRAGPSTTTTTTYNSVSMTEVAEICNDNLCLSLWYLINPIHDGASYNLVHNYSAATRHASVAVAFNGVHQTTAIGTFAANDTSGFRSTTSATVSSAGDELVIDCAAHDDTVLTLNVDGAQTQQAVEASDDATTANNVRVALSSKAGAGSVTMTWSVDGGTAVLKNIAVPIKPAMVASAAQPQTPLNYQ